MRLIDDSSECNFLDNVIDILTETIKQLYKESQTLRKRARLLASQEKNEWPREDHTDPFAHPERTWIVRVHQKGQDQPGAKVEPSRRTTAPDRRAQAIFFRRRHQPRRHPLARIRPGMSAPTVGPGTTKWSVVSGSTKLIWFTSRYQCSTPSPLTSMKPPTPACRMPLLGLSTTGSSV